MTQCTDNKCRNFIAMACWWTRRALGLRINTKSHDLYKNVSRSWAVRRHSGCIITCNHSLRSKDWTIIATSAIPRTKESSLVSGIILVLRLNCYIHLDNWMDDCETAINGEQRDKSIRREILSMFLLFFPPLRIQNVEIITELLHMDDGQSRSLFK